MLKNTKLCEVKRVLIPKAEPNWGDSLSKAMVIGAGVSLDDSVSNGYGASSSRKIDNQGVSESRLNMADLPSTIGSQKGFADPGK